MRGGPVQRLGVPVTAFLGIVVAASGITGLVLLAVPGSTDRYFSWRLGPTPAAAVVGGFYLAAAVTFGWALTLPWSQVRSLLFGVLGLAVPTLVLTFVHDEVFDFDRWQAIAWVALFATAPVAALALLATVPPEPGSSRRLRPMTRTVLALLAVALMTVAALVWLDSTRDDVEGWSPVDLVRLTGAYLGAWCSFLAVLCGVSAVQDRWDAARLPLVALGLAAVGVVVGLLRSVGDVDHAPAALAVTVAGGLLAAGLYAAERPG